MKQIILFLKKRASFENRSQIVNLLKIAMILVATFSTSSLLAATLPAGSVVYWGYGVETPSEPSKGTLAIGSEEITNAVAIAAGSYHSLALLADGRVVGWGLNDQGQATGVPSAAPRRTNGVVRIAGKELNNAVAIAAGSTFSLALRNDHTVTAWGNKRAVVGAVIGAGSSNDLAIGEDGSFATLGLAPTRNTDVPASWSNVIAIAAGGPFSLALKADGTLVGTGSAGTLVGLSNVIAIAMGEGWRGLGFPAGLGVALLKEGSVLEWQTRGDSADDPFHRGDVVAIAAGGMHCLALTREGSVVSWGPIEFGISNVPPGLSNVVAIAAARRHNLALKKDGTVASWGFPPGYKLQVPDGLRDVVAIATGNGFSLAITTNAAVANQFRKRHDGDAK